MLLLILEQLAKIKKIYYIPEILKNIAEKPALMQEDGIHPNAKAQNKILQRIMPTLLKLIKKQKIYEDILVFSVNTKI